MSQRCPYAAPRRVVLLVLLACSSLTGCIRSVQPFFADADSVFENSLLGSWVGLEGRQMWLIGAVDKRSYRLTIVGEDGRGVFAGRLARLKGTLFLDLSPAEGPRLSQNALFAALLMPMHVVARVEIAENQLRVRPLNGVWLDRELRAKPKLLRHERRGDKEVLLTASSLELGAFLAAQAKNEEAFGPQELVLHRLVLPEDEKPDPTAPEPRGEG